MNKTMILAVLNPEGLPMLRIAGALFIIINLLAGGYVVRHWRTLFGPDPNAEGDFDAVRYLRIVGVVAPLFVLTFRLVVIEIGFWIN
jgi:hypothetical protein